MAYKPVFFCDNINTKHLVSNPVLHARMKHVELDFHLLQEQVNIEILGVRYTPLENQMEYILTKPLGEEIFVSLRTKQMLLQSPSI